MARTSQIGWRSWLTLGAFFLGTGPWQALATGAEPRKEAAKEEKPVAGLSEYLAQTNAEIQKMLDEYSRLPKKPIGFGCNLTLAHGGTIHRVPLEVLEACADALKESGASRIEINPVVSAHAAPETAAKYKALVQHIRKLGMKLAINPESTTRKTAGSPRSPSMKPPR